MGFAYKEVQTKSGPTVELNIQGISFTYVNISARCFEYDAEIK